MIELIWQQSDQTVFFTLKIWPQWLSPDFAHAWLWSVCKLRLYFLSCATLLWTSCEQHRQVYAYISMGVGHSQLIHRRVTHDLKYSLWGNSFRSQCPSKLTLFTLIYYFTTLNFNDLKNNFFSSVFSNFKLQHWCPNILCLVLGQYSLLDYLFEW